jgi:uncharacterized pyridoxamine 5'-phosphate oxidase family protein
MLYLYCNKIYIFTCNVTYFYRRRGVKSEQNVYAICIYCTMDPDFVILRLCNTISLQANREVHREFVYNRGDFVEKYFTKTKRFCSEVNSVLLYQRITLHQVTSLFPFCLAMQVYHFLNHKCYKLLPYNWQTNLGVSWYNQHFLFWGTLFGFGYFSNSVK